MVGEDVLAVRGGGLHHADVLGADVAHGLGDGGGEVEPERGLAAEEAAERVEGDGALDRVEVAVVAQVGDGVEVVDHVLLVEGGAAVLGEDGLAFLHAGVDEAGEAAGVVGGAVDRGVVRGAGLVDLEDVGFEVVQGHVVGRVGDADLVEQVLVVHHGPGVVAHGDAHELVVHGAGLEQGVGVAAGVEQAALVGAEVEEQALVGVLAEVARVHHEDVGEAWPAASVLRAVQ
nr:hypothetical protein GCM10025732_33720 [Glycomyces mayteni]